MDNSPIQIELHIYNSYLRRDEFFFELVVSEDFDSLFEDDDVTDLDSPDEEDFGTVLFDLIDPC